MAWRFKASKYKNAAPIVPKPETCIRDICVGSYQTYGNNICASAAFMAFNWEHVGSSMAVLPLDDCGRKSKTMPLLHAHSDTITDMEFSPFHDGLLLTGSQDSLVKVWHIPPEGLKESLSTPECTLSQKQRRVENVGFHPVADGLIHVASGHELALWDLTKQKEAFVNRDHAEVIQSTSWKKDGRLLATSCKDKKVRVIDPRAASPILEVANSHQNIKDSRVVWLGDQDRILTTGFDSARLRQIMIRDIRNLSQTQKTLELDCSTGILMPLFDADTNMLFLAGKGDTTILYMELTDREPYLIEGLRHSGEQTKGACLVPKRALRVMEGEVNRVLQLTGSSVVPIMYQVPRKSYREYHADLYPDTSGCMTYLSAPMWLDNQDYPVPNISLHPNANNCTQVHRGNLEEVVKAVLAMPPPKKTDTKKATTPAQIEEPSKPVQKAQPTPEPKDEDRIDFVNVKDLIKGMERQKNKEPTTDVKETNGFHKKITDNGHDYEKKTEDVDTEKSDASDCTEKTEKTVEKTEKTFEKTDSSESTESSLSRSNSLINGVQVPKPLPRSSISEASSVEDHSEVPKPKPRTTAVPISGYKPRLGPKPFSASTGNEEFSFDKVFSVPAVPGLPKSDSATSPLSGPTATTPVSTPPVVKEPVEEKEKSLSPTSDVDVAPNKEEYTNGKSDTSLEEEVNSSDSGYRPKTPSTAERRKLFETTDGNNQSIADRRRAYEMRSVSVAVESETPPSPAPLRRRDSLKSRKSPDREDKRASVPNVATKRTSTVFGKVSKFRHLKGTPAHKSLHVENIKNISRQVSGECNGFYANGVHCAVPLSGGGGRVGIITMPLGATRRARGAPPLPGGMVPHALLHPAPLQDWAWDPFDDDRLMVACDDGLVREWIIEEGGLLESSNEPERTFAAHPDKIYLIRFHPTASNLLTTAAHDLTIKIWDLTPEVPVAAITLTGHGDQIFSIDWSPCGEYLATVCRDGLIRIYKPRASTEPLRSGPGPAGSRGARVVWALNATHLVVTGFDKVSERQIYLYKASDLSAPICTVGLDVSPAILQIHIDHDSGTLFLTGRGDSTIYCYEVTCEPPYVCALSHHRAMTLHQGIAFLQKNICAVEKVEFAKALRLTNGTIEPLSFTVPRIKSELFQDDLFPPTLVTWEPWQSGADWLAGRLVPPRTVSLQPPGMEPLSAHTTVSPVAREPREAQKPKPDLIRSHTPLDAKQKQENIMKSMSAKMAVDLKLEQDSMEGVDETEWDQ
ncbi:coronin-7 isoform X10 [Ostrinia furnacalis]|uniref:coronin-7 isoform X1 n=1 Tax=Ostrinia furnacalis TaxID=93504 RepID=UPI001040877A|nr:coronin-7 isoform X1 [Ostrinia furnacalis]XP_028164815.1 coronin-7 isoform X2 [Ostrinia furnacalis]XP_028164817.1 coronin-7 isoform X3 [Ostrinia furnacalis]XP_028164818.1 coronin-7 isoform X4 [Ostrinia furnacalis]XP_028164820.1 coronin-7 isoform X6 [Ostrinia furnacalis]XP_028164821.1 coronin-7 isoform X7 [Ostrinia furnacalis]XP_028164822.1 coronin-7 isoform X1 [Ostrinia furnacalis]XP_028164823.1 coronin-7 isoform X8 [Ostrinia furnacalis]XP_028164824.1 coronin-7 isoform X9 [Ostrinia furna